MCASKPKDSAIRAVLRTILDVCTPEAMRHVAYSERNCDTALSSSCILFTFVVLTGFSTCKDRETRPHTDGFRQNNANYWDLREICRFYLYSSIMGF